MEMWEAETEEVFIKAAEQRFIPRRDSPPV